MALTYLHPATVSGRTYLAPAVPPAGATSVTASLSASYAVRAAVSASLSASYAVRAAVSKDLAIAYLVSGATGGPVGVSAATISAARKVKFNGGVRVVIFPSHS